MQLSDHQKRIIDILTPKPTHHGQLEVRALIAPEGADQMVDSLRVAFIEESLKKHGSNLIPLVVRSRNDEDDTYEVIHGVDWLIAARNIQLKRLWVWSFPLNDDQAQAIKEQMDQFFVISDPPKPTPGQLDEIRLTQLIDRALDQKISKVLDSINQRFDEQRNLKINTLGIEEKLTAITKILDNAFPDQRKIIKALVEASEDMITAKLRAKPNVTTPQCKAALAAIKLWKQQQGELNWDTLAQCKIKGFGKTTFEKIKAIRWDQD